MSAARVRRSVVGERRRPSASRDGPAPEPELGRDVGVAHHRRRPERRGLEHRHALRLEADRGLHDGVGGRMRAQRLGVRHPAREDDGCPRAGASRRAAAPRAAARRRRSPRRRRRRPTRRAPRGRAAGASRGSCARARRTAAGRACARPTREASTASSTSSSMPFQITSTAARSRASRCAPPRAATGTTPCSSSRRAKCDDGAVTASDRPAKRRRYAQPSRPTGCPPRRPPSARRCQAFSTRSTRPGKGAVASMPTSTRLCIVCTTGSPCRAANRCPMNAPQKSACTCTTSTGGRRSRHAPASQHQPIRAASRPRDRVLAVERDRDRGQVEVRRIRLPPRPRPRTVHRAARRS